ncbi:MAG: M23 family metallopeptidase [Bacteroidales bacterium]|nr:M23 family metallopeptidase [Bacteroides sp.]MCM1199171.1 M23 family metallopeptidase [Clostridium sp.]MCM1502416.1 M23 family metallopeptidase [Bacteroidales bacterium]
MRQFLVLAAFMCGGLCLSGSLYAQSTLTKEEAEIILPRLPLQPVKSLVDTETRALDTLDTGVEYVKVVLFDNNTWRYIKDPSYVTASDVFTDSWDVNAINPYRVPLDSLPESWTVWMVDSLGQYHCPYQGNIHPRGKFGIRRGRRHQGVDLPFPNGTPVHAAFDGKVRMSKYVNGYGNLIVVRHENGLETFYGHLSKRNVEPGDWICAGDVIGLGGSTGRSSGPHLHFEARYKGYAFDPQWLINFSTGELRHRLFLLKRRQFNPYSNYEQDFEDEFRNDEEDRKEDAERAAMKYVTVKSGDTLGRIAINNHTTVKELCRLNGITTKTVLKIGRRLRVK